MGNFENYLHDARLSDRVLFSVMGPHANETVSDIFVRKIEDIARVGHTYWLHRSWKAKPDHVQMFCNGTPLFVLFLNPSAKGGARETIETQVATHFSSDAHEWFSMPAGLSAVTGKMNMAHAFKFDVLIEATPSDYPTIDLWKYRECGAGNMPVRFKLGASTLCAERGDTSLSSNRMTSHQREIVAIGRLCSPFSVWLRKGGSEDALKLPQQLP
jgi:hypothetical protein